MSGFIEGESRHQTTLFLEALDEYIQKDNPPSMAMPMVGESLRVCRRLNSLSGFSNEDKQTIFPGSPGTGGSQGMVSEHQHEHGSQWATIESIAAKIGCTAETLRRWVRQSEIDQGSRGGVSTSDRERLKELERENRELKRANEILRTASAFFAQAELDRKLKR